MRKHAVTICEFGSLNRNDSVNQSVESPAQPGVFENFENILKELIKLICFVHVGCSIFSINKSMFVDFSTYFSVSRRLFMISTGI